MRAVAARSAVVQAASTAEVDQSEEARASDYACLVTFERLPCSSCWQAGYETPTRRGGAVMPFGPHPSLGLRGDGSHTLESNEEDVNPDRLYESEIEQLFKNWEDKQP